MTTSLITRQGPDENALAVYSKVNDVLAYVEAMGKYIAQSGMFGCKNDAQGKVLAMACACKGVNPIDFALEFHIMHDGKIAKRADAMLAQFNMMGGKHRWIHDGEDGQAAELLLSIDGEELSIRYTIDQARKSELVRDRSTWDKDPASMLRARCISRGIRMIRPQIVAGYYAPEEIDEESNGAAPAKRTRKAGGDSGASASSPIPQATAQAATEEPPFDTGEKNENVIDAEIVSDANVATTAEPVPTGTPTGGTTGTEMSVDDPCTPTQVNQIKSLLNDIGTVDPSIHDKIKGNLASRGKNTLADLTWKEAEGLFKALSQKAHQVFAEQALAGKVGAADAKN